ncbi:uncharacterized protein A1O9_08849 [Exophiala aquamarina CBS 119918]|uniref:Enoyl-CoA hydratase n=1 Tax=Exophiala aquamarina CBS 119918 TaxID=1182545 RepID=A0A072PI47_9EURO|nr:uncharacterized protein A1O9_08849 [Exophiala aquamarina CBS 119918]KEF55195.1 hypothetical protein A1O9_08849 [Exophiala aquamarina CBS 119918]
MSSSGYKYEDVILEIKGKIGVIKLNRPSSLNAFGGTLLLDLVTALRELDEHPDTIFTVLTGEGRFFSSGADVKAESTAFGKVYASAAQKKIDYIGGMYKAIELMRSMIDHRKVLVLALNGPAVGGGAAWFPGVVDIILSVEDAYLQTPFSALGLVPEFGSSTIFAQSIGVHRANDFLMFGTKLTAREMRDAGMINHLFPREGFQKRVLEFLEGQLEINDGKSMMEMKRLQNMPLRGERILAVFNAADALAERIVEDAPKKRFEEKKALLLGESPSWSHIPPFLHGVSRTELALD